MLSNVLTETVKAHTPAWVETLARLGYAALGVVYCLMGTLTAMAAFGFRGGEQADQKDSFRFLLRQPGGKVLLGAVALGLIGYVIWQIVQVIKDPQHADSGSAKSYGRRIGYAFSGFFYGVLAFYAGSLVLGNDSSGGDTGGRQLAVTKMLELPMGKWLVLLVAAGTIGFGISQIIKGLSGSFMKYVQEGNVDPRIRKLVGRAGRLGYLARGIVFGIIGYLMGKAALTYNPSAAGDTEKAFRFMQSSSVPYLMGIVALGLVCYGIFLFVRARYQNFSF
jgi:hypothetical protein